MRNWLFICISTILFSCEEDALIPCSDEQPSGKICREYRYFNNAPQGFVTFEHEADSLIISTVYNQNSVVRKTIREQYKTGKLVAITEQVPDRPSRVETWHYNELDSLSFIIYGADDSILQIAYEDGKRLRESLLIDDVVTHYTEYRYFEDDGNLYRVSDFDANDSLLSYRNYDYFSGNDGTFYRTSHYSGNYELIGRKRYGFTQLGLISSMEYRLADGTLAESKNYIYDVVGKLIEKTAQRGNNTSKSVYLYN